MTLWAFFMAKTLRCLLNSELTTHVPSPWHLDSFVHGTLPRPYHLGVAEEQLVGWCLKGCHAPFFVRYCMLKLLLRRQVCLSASVSCYRAQHDCKQLYAGRL